METHDLGGTQTSLGKTQSPLLPLLHVNRKICQETKTLHSSGVVTSGRIPTALEAVAAVCEAKKRCIKLIKVTVDRILLMSLTAHSKTTCLKDGVRLGNDVLRRACGAPPRRCAGGSTSSMNSDLSRKRRACGSRKTSLCLATGSASRSTSTGIEGRAFWNEGEHEYGVTEL